MAGDAVILETPRLRMRPLGRPDLQALTALFNRPEVGRYLWDGKTLDTAEVETLLRENEKLFRRERLGLWGLSLPGDEATLVGCAGFWYFHQPPELELLYGLAGDHWGQGFATEAASAAARYAVERLGLRRLVASADVPNEASHRVMERLGLRFDRRALDEGIDTVWYVCEVDRAPDHWSPVRVLPASPSSPDPAGPDSTS